MPNQMFREGLVDSEQVNYLSDSAFRFFVHLMLVADDAGRYDGRAEVLRARLFPASSRRVNDVRKMIEENQAQRLLLCYSVDGKPYVQLVKWQRRGNSQRSKYPAPDGSFEILYVDVETRDGTKEFVASSMIEVTSEPLTDGIGMEGKRPSTSSYTSTPSDSGKGGVGGKPLWEIPESIRTPDFESAWTDFVQHRFEIRRKLTPVAAKQLMTRFVGWGADRAITAIRYSISNGWQGVFEEDSNSGRIPTGGKHGSKPSSKIIRPGRAAPEVHA